MTVFNENGATEVPGATDEFAFMPTGGPLKNCTPAQLSERLLAIGDFATAAKGVTNGDTHDHNGGDGAQIDHVNLANKGTNTHATIDEQLPTADEKAGIDGISAADPVVKTSSASLPVTNLQALRDYTGAATSLFSLGHTTAGDGEHGYFRLITGEAPGTYTDNDKTIIVPTGGDGSTAWLLLSRQIHYNDPIYDFAAGLLAVDDYYQVGTITIPTGKQYNVIRMDGNVTGGDKFKGIDFNFTVQNGDDAYCAIGLLTNKGDGPAKAFYGRVQASVGCTGAVVGLVAGTTIDAGVTPADEIGVQISMDGTGTSIASRAIEIDTNETSKSIDHGLLSLATVEYDNAFIKGHNTGTGSLIKWQNDNGFVVFEIDKDGALYVRSATGGQLFHVTSGGNVQVGTTANAQKTVSLFSATTEYQVQAVTSGDRLRIRDNTASRDLISLNGGAGGATDPVQIWVGGALRTVEVGAPDSGGTGYRMLRVANQ